MTAEHGKPLILVADEAPATFEALRRDLLPGGYRVFVAASMADALRALAGSRVDLVIANVRLPGADELALVRHVAENLDATAVVAITNYASVDGAVSAVRAGAHDYLPKPIARERLLAAVQAALDARRARTPAPARLDQGFPGAFGLWGESAPMKEVLRAIGKAASITATVLVHGESGTGKELVARAIHYSSARASAPFVAVNCGAIPETLLESELFGYVKGAFTGAAESRAGFFQTADGGTIFLDEVSETSPSMQVKLLRVLQDREICMVGATRPRRVDVRIVASTNRDPQKLVSKGLLREDLFYRLNVIAIAVPPLRERGDDTLLLTRHFAARFAEAFGRSTPQFSDAALRALARLLVAGQRARARERRPARRRDVRERRHRRPRPAAADAGRTGARARAGATARRGRARPHPHRAGDLRRQPQPRGTGPRHRPQDAALQAGDALTSNADGAMGNISSAGRFSPGPH